MGEPCSANTCETYFYDYQPRTLILGFSKGGVVLNQLISELAFLEGKSIGSGAAIQEEIQIVPTTKEGLLDSIKEIHYIDVGLNSAGAYISDPNVIERISKRLMESSRGLHFILHGTPRQWCDGRRAWICDEKDKLVHLLEQESHKNGGILQVCERFYFADRPPNMQMHFEIIESLNVN